MKESYNPTVEHQCRLNPTMKKVVRAEMMKLLKAEIIYAILNSPWVSPIQVVPKKGGMTVSGDEKNERIPIRT